VTERRDDAGRDCRFIRLFSARFDLATGDVLFEGVKEYIVREETEEKKVSKAKANASYRTLLEAGDRIAKVIRESEKGANKDMIKLARLINDLCDKWENY